LPSRTDGPLGVAGLSLDEVRDIAGEVGLAAQFVEQAAASLPHESSLQGRGLLGGPWTHQLADTFPRTLGEAEQMELVDVIRGTLKHHGRVKEVLGSLEWETLNRVDQLTVTVNSTDDNVSVRIFDDLSGVAALTWVGSLTAALIASGVIVDAIQPDSLLVTASILGGGATAGLGVARAIWSRTTKAFRSRAERLRDEIARHLLR